MKPIPFLVATVLGACYFLAAQTSFAAPAPRVFYAGGAGGEKISCLVELPDKTILAAGSADDLNWLRPGTPVSNLSAPGIRNAGGGGRIGFLMQMSSDLSTVNRVVALPKGAAQDISKVKLSAAGLFISGTTSDSQSAGGGYFIAKLNGNFSGGAPTKADWVYNVWATGDHQSFQPWDVGSDGKVVFVTGQTFGYDWCAVHRLNAQGQRDIVPRWRTHWTKAGKEMRGEAGTIADVSYSGVVFKPKGRADLRSWTSVDYGRITDDGAGGKREGKWPLDLFFNSAADPTNPGLTASGPGYTGYKLGASATGRVVGVAVHPTDGSIYLGFSIQSRLPDGNPDFEPGVVAFTKDGALKWWSRLYTETAQNSTPDQYVDGLAIDAANGQLVVLARAHGNNTYNLWNGRGAFHNNFTGTSGNIHISWLGKLKLDNGQPTATTYVAEYTDGMEGTSAAYSDPNLDGWPDHNQGWPNLNTTRCSGDLRVDSSGRVYVTGVGRRTITTKNAYQKMLKKAEGKSSWNSWVRVYEKDFKTVVYSSILTGKWDPATGAGGDNTQLLTVCPIREAVLTAGTSLLGGTAARGNPIPVINVPLWGTSTPKGADAIMARMAVPLPSAATTAVPENAPSSGSS